MKTFQLLFLNVINVAQCKLFDILKSLQFHTMIILTIKFHST